MATTKKDITKMYEVGQGKYSEYVKSITMARKLGALFLRKQSKVAKTPVMKNGKVIGWVVYNEYSNQYAWVVKGTKANVFYHMTKDGKLGRKF